MPIKRAINVAMFGAPAEFHKVSNYSVDTGSSSSTVTVLMYFNEQAQMEGRLPLTSEHICIQGVPPEDQPTVAWIERKLIEEAPAGDPTQPVSGYQAPNRYVLAGGVVVPANT